MPDELQREKMSIEVGTLLDAEEAPTSKSIKDTQLDDEYQKVTRGPCFLLILKFKNSS